MYLQLKHKIQGMVIVCLLTSACSTSQPTHQGTSVPTLNRGSTPSTTSTLSPPHRSGGAATRATPAAAQRSRPNIRLVPATGTPAEPLLPHYAQPTQTVLQDGQRIPAVVQLLHQADHFAHIRRYDLETHVLDQALRLAPQSPLVYERLALMRIAERRYLSAVNMSRRGLLYARTTAVQSQLWGIMATAYRGAHRTTDAAWAQNMQTKLYPHL